MMLSVTSHFFFFKLFAVKETRRSTVWILLIYVRFIVINVIDISFFGICIARLGTMDEKPEFIFSVHCF